VNVLEQLRGEILCDLLYVHVGVHVDDPDVFGAVREVKEIFSEVKEIFSEVNDVARAF
jgi:hypothetical protein